METNNTPTSTTSSTPAPTADANTTTTSNTETGGAPNKPVAPLSTFDEFMNVDFSDQPQLQEIMSSEHTGLPHYKDLLNKHTTVEGKKLLANMRADYTRKTQEIASIRKQMADREAAILAREQSLYQGDFARKVNETATKDATNLDPYVQEDLAQIIEIQTAKRLQDMLKPYQEEIASKQHMLEAQQFVERHPEMKTEAFKEKLIPLLSSRGDLDLETAYLIVKGQLADVQATAQQEQTKLKQTAKEAARQTIAKTTGTQNAGPATPPRRMSPTEALKFFASQKKG